MNKNILKKSVHTLNTTKTNTASYNYVILQKQNYYVNSFCIQIKLKHRILCYKKISLKDLIIKIEGRDFDGGRYQQNKNNIYLCN